MCSDILDLAAQLCRRYLGPLTITMCLGAVPLAIVNYFLTSWMVQLDPDGALYGDEVLQAPYGSCGQRCC